MSCHIQTFIILQKKVSVYYFCGEHNNWLEIIKLKLVHLHIRLQNVRAYFCVSAKSNCLTHKLWSENVLQQKLLSSLLLLTFDGDSFFKARSRYVWCCGMHLTVATLQRDRKIPISTLTQSSVESADCYSKSESAFTNTLHSDLSFVHKCL